MYVCFFIATQSTSRTSATTEKKSDASTNDTGKKYFNILLQ